MGWSQAPKSLQTSRGWGCSSGGKLRVVNRAGALQLDSGGTSEYLDFLDVLGIPVYKADLLKI